TRAPPIPMTYNKFSATKVKA
ncbi:unnamed protein product, partial [Oikopleura dioica]